MGQSRQGLRLACLKSGLKALCANREERRDCTASQEQAPVAEPPLASTRHGHEWGLGPPREVRGRDGGRDRSGHVQEVRQRGEHRLPERHARWSGPGVCDGDRSPPTRKKLPLGLQRIQAAREAGEEGEGAGREEGRRAGSPLLGIASPRRLGARRRPTAAERCSHFGPSCSRPSLARNSKPHPHSTHHLAAGEAGR